MHRLQPHRRALVIAVLMCVLLVQWLGTVHGIAHTPGPAGSPATAHAAAPEGQAAPAGATTGTPQGAWFGVHDDESQCRLFDQLAHADLVWQLAPLLVEPRGCAEAPGTWAGGRIAPQAAGYLARGPPPRA